MYRYFYYITLLLFLLTSCSEEENPTSFQPKLSVSEARNITRTTATINGEIEIHGANTIVSDVKFRYGNTPAMLQTITCVEQTYTPCTQLVELQPSTTYFYCLEVGNGRDVAQSPVRQLTTKPLEIPSLSELTLVSQGPISITLEFSILDDGGEPLDAAGFRLYNTQGQSTDIPIKDYSSNILTGRIGKLQPETTYTVRAYTRNSVGEAVSLPYSFHTSHSVTVTTPGMLPETIGEEEKYILQKLSVTGPLNGTDLRFIRDMLGQGLEGQTTPGTLKELNLTDATIHQGGLSYDGKHFTQNNQIGQQMFAHSQYLEKLHLPQTATAILKDAIEECPHLTILHIPLHTSQVEPSIHCPRLTTLVVPESSPYFRTSDGILYNRTGTRLIWFPEGKTTATFLPTVQQIGPYAFRCCQISQLTLPAGITEIDLQAFREAKFTKIILPQGITHLKKALFQSCHQLTSITLGNRTAFIDEYCFDDCPLSQLYVLAADVPPHCEENSFNASFLEYGTLYVPQEAYQLYRNHPIWGKFQHIEICPSQ